MIRHATYFVVKEWVYNNTGPKTLINTEKHGGWQYFI